MIVLPCPIRFDQWPAIAARNNLLIHRILIGENLQLTLVVEGDIWCTDDERITTMPEAAKRLQKILTDMLKLAETIPGKPVRRELAGGLRVDILVGDKDGITRLQLSRPYTWPSATEFAVTLNNLPFDLPLDIEPDRMVHQERYYLRCQWITQQTAAASPTPLSHPQGALNPEIAGKQ